MSDTPELNDDFADMLLCLQRASVEFVLVGAHALAAALSGEGRTKMSMSPVARAMP